MYIIAGRYKGRKIDFFATNKKLVRPTTSYVKEALFNILIHSDLKGYNSFYKENAVFLELFAGSASITFEAISRGINKAVVVEKNNSIVQNIQHNLEKLGFEDNMLEIICADAIALPRAFSRQKADICYCDPPYNKNLLLPTLISLHRQRWLNKNSLVIIESSDKEKFDLNQIRLNHLFEILDSRQYSNTFLTFLRYKGEKKAVANN